MTDASKPLASVSRVLDKGNRVALSRGAEGSHIENTVTGEWMPLDEERGAFALEVEWLEPEVSQRDSARASGFSRPAGRVSAEIGGCKPVRPCGACAVGDGEAVVGEGSGSDAGGGERGSSIPVRSRIRSCCHRRKRRNTCTRAYRLDRGGVFTVRAERVGAWATDEAKASEESENRSWATLSQ